MKNLIIIMLLIASCTPTPQKTAQREARRSAIEKVSIQKLGKDSMKELAYGRLDTAGYFFNMDSVVFVHRVGMEVQFVTQEDLMIAGVKNMNSHDQYR